MARAYHTDGVEPVKTRTVKRDDGIDIELPYCNICECEMNDVRVAPLLFWQPGFKYTRKYPLRLGTFLCEPCRQEMGFGAHSYVAVPCSEGTDLVSALKDYLNLIEEHQKRLPSS